MKRISKSQSKNEKFEEYYICLFGGDYQEECDNYIFRSKNHDMYLEKVRKSILSPFDERSSYVNNIESVPWNQY